MYMSYCRHEGTLSEVRACLGAVQEHIWGEAEYPTSEKEIRMFKTMIQEVVAFLQENEVLTADGELDENRLDEIGEAMKQAGEVEEY